MKNVLIAVLCAGAASAQEIPAPAAPVPPGVLSFQARSGRTITLQGAGNYDAGTRDLDAHRYEDAIRRFDSVIESKASQADGALYWKAYSLNRIGRRDDAIAAIGVLRHDYPASHWLNDAQALEAEVKQGAGQGVPPGDNNNEDLKLMAINSLMGGDPDRAIPLLETVLKGNAPPRVKDRALFVLTQSRTPRAQQIIAEYAKGAGNPDLQMNAIRYIGMSGTATAQQQLAAIYASSTDQSIKREILRSLMMSRATDQLLNLAKNEKDIDLRIEAIRQLGMLHPGSDSIVSLYAPDSDPRVKREVLNALRSRGDAKGLVDMARKETDPAMKRQIVSQLATMRNNKEATDYMMELLK